METGLLAAVPFLLFAEKYGKKGGDYHHHEGIVT